MISLPNPEMNQTQVELKTETQDFITHLVEEESFCEEDIYEFIQQYGEDDFVNYYEEYVELGESQTYQAVDAFVEEFGFENLSHFDDAYRGEWESGEHFAESFVSDCYSLNLPGFVEVDWQATWNNLEYDFLFNNGFVFDRNF